MPSTHHDLILWGPPFGRQVVVSAQDSLGPSSLWSATARGGTELQSPSVIEAGSGGLLTGDHPIVEHIKGTAFVISAARF